MKNKDYNNELLRKYKYLLTIARRDGTKKIVFRLLAENGSQLDISLPPNIDANGVEEYLSNYTHCQNKHKKIRIKRYLGGKKEKNDGARYFAFSCEF